MSEPILSLTGISKSFGGVVVLEDVSFDVAHGTRHALIGPNGAGKTTLFNLISGVFPMDGGTLRFEGKDIGGIPSRHRIRLGLARSFQNIRLMPHLSVVENVMLGQHAASGFWSKLRPVGFLPGAREKREAEETLAAFGMEAHRGQVVANLPYLSLIHI